MKRILSLASALCLTIALVGCENKTETPPPSTDSTPSTTTEGTAPEHTETAAPSGEHAETPN